MTLIAERDRKRYQKVKIYGMPNQKNIYISNGKGFFSSIGNFLKNNFGKIASNVLPIALDLGAKALTTASQQNNKVGDVAKTIQSNLNSVAPVINKLAPTLLPATTAVIGNALSQKGVSDNVVNQISSTSQNLLRDILKRTEGKGLMKSIEPKRRKKGGSVFETYNPPS